MYLDSVWDSMEVCTMSGVRARARARDRVEKLSKTNTRVGWRSELRFGTGVRVRAGLGFAGGRT